MEKEIEVLEKKTKQVRVCDDCSREVDDEGVEDHSCDFCSVCAPAYVDEEPAADGVMTVDEWKSNMYSGDSWTPEENFTRARTFHRASTIITVVGLCILALYLGNPVPILLGIVVTFVATISHILFGHFLKQYVEAVGDE